MTMMQVFLRSITFRCPHCGHGRLARKFYIFNHHCNHCGYAYLPDDGDFWGGVVICYVFSGATGIASAGLMVAFLDISVGSLVYAATGVTVCAVLLLFPWCKSAYVYLLYYLRGQDEEYRAPEDFQRTD